MVAPSNSPILAEHTPLVMLSTPHPMFRDYASAAAKLPCPMPFIMVAPSVSPSGVSIEISVLLFR